MNRNKLLVYFVVLLAALIVSFFATSARFDARTVGLLIFFLVFIPTLINPDIGLVIIIVSMLFSPEIIFGWTTQREVTIRIEDVFLLVVILAWFIRAAFTKDIFKVFKTKLTVPFFLYIGTCIISTAFAIISSDIDIRHAFLSILKYLEYFLLFLIVKAHINSLKQSKVFVVVFLLVALLVAVYSNIFIQQQQAAGSTFFRVAPPVETRGGGEAGTIGGYLVFMMAIAGGLLLYMRPLAIRIFLICLIMLMFMGFLYTLSRGSYLAFLFMLLTFFFLSRKITFACVAIICLTLVVIFFPSMVKERIATTVTARQGIRGTYLELDESPRGRLESWKFVLFERFPRSPIFGYGVGKYFVDGQIFLTLGEVGLAGLILLVWVLVRLFKMARDVFNIELIKNDEFSRGFSLGFLTGLVGLIGQALSTNTFIIIRIMEPFWFMAAIVLSLPQVLQQEKGLETEAR